MILSSLGARASAPTDWVSASAVRDVQVWEALSYVQTPPWAAPRTIVPSLRTTRAPIRPLIAANVFDVRTTCTIGFGPWGAQAPPRVSPGSFTSRILPASWLGGAPRGRAALPTGRGGA